MGPTDDELKAVFGEAADLPPGPGRIAYLDRACPAGTPLRARVEALLRAHDAAGRFLGSSVGPAGDRVPGVVTTVAATSTAGWPASPDPGAATATATRNSPGPRPAGEGPGTRIGPYSLLRVLGEGAWASSTRPSRPPPSAGPWR